MAKSAKSGSDKGELDPKMRKGCEKGAPGGSVSGMLAWRGAIVKPHFGSQSEALACTGCYFDDLAETHPSGRYD